MAIRPVPKVVLLLLALAILALGTVGCGRDDDDNGGEAADTAASADTTTTEALSGDVIVDGSSTVGPLTTGAAESFREQQPDVNVEVGISGTGGGFERFCAGETDISDASRPIEDDEASICADAGIEYDDYNVAIDAITMIVNVDNDWATCLTTEQLKKIWEPKAEKKITNWNQVDPSFPDVPLTLAGPGTDSGTFDYFTDAINGEEGASRTDYNASEDDNVTVQAVAGDEGGLGYLGYTYYEENTDTLKALEVDGGNGCVAPSAETAQDGTYAPLSRPLFIYLKTESLTTKPQVAGFADYYLNNAISLADQFQFIPVTDEVVSENLSTFQTQQGR